MELTWGESIRDKAARLMPTPFTELVEQATSELLLSPDYERIMALCDHANLKPDVNTDLVRAVRRRIDHRIPKVRYFTIVLLEALIKNCGLPTHEEIADQKGLLRDLVHQALGGVGEDLEQEAKTSALQLILNCSYWFRPEVRGTHDKLKVLADLADAVRKAQPEIFTGMAPDTTVTLALVPHAAHPAPARDASARARARTHAARAAPAPRVSRAGPPVVVDAIPIIPPTEEELSGMMDGVMLLVDCLNGLEERKASPAGDEMVTAIAAEVRQQHRRIATLISSGAELSNMEVLLSICDSQVAVIQRLASLFRLHGQHDAANEHTLPSRVAPAEHTPENERSPAENAVHPTAAPPAANIDIVLGVQASLSASGESYPPRPAAQAVSPPVSAASAPPPPIAPAPAVHPPAPTIDDLFGEVQSAEANPPVPPAPKPAPTVRTAADTEDHPPSAQRDPVVAASLNGDDEFDAFLNHRLGA